MKNIKIISAIIAIIVLVGGGYLVYSDYQAQEAAQQQRDAQAKAQADAAAQQQAAEAALAARTKCVDVDNYSVITLDHDGAVGQDILVKQKQDGAVCKYDATDAVFEVKSADPEYYKFQAANALVTDLGTGPSGRSIRLYDLGDKKMITEKKYFGDLTLVSTTLTYFGEPKQKVTMKNCKDGVVAVEKTVDLKTFLVKEGKTTKCVAIQ